MKRPVRNTLRVLMNLLTGAMFAFGVFLIKDADKKELINFILGYFVVVGFHSLAKMTVLGTSITIKEWNKK
jgi:hypothetical protein